jgi:SAM-dependent methyltransferase
MGELTAAELREQVIALGPWHIDMEITPEVSTSAFLEAPPGTYPDDLGEVTFHDPHDGFLRRIHRIYPDGLEGRSVLDCACNCGAFLFFAKEAGAGRCVGFDLREHWIRQARFLQEHRSLPSDDMRFEVANLYDLPQLELGRFDVTFFFGILYHLPDPVTGLKLAADITDELLIVNTATKARRPDGLLVAEHESPTRVMSGTYGLCWFPTGPLVLERILNWMGFPEVRCSVWRHAPRQREDLDRIEILAARTPGFFDDWERRAPQGRLMNLLETRTQPGSTIIALGEAAASLEPANRRLVPVASGSDGLAAIAEVDDDGAEGVWYVAALEDGLAALDADARLASHLAESATLTAEGTDHRVYELPPPSADGAV